MKYGETTVSEILDPNILFGETQIGDFSGGNTPSDEGGFLFPKSHFTKIVRTLPTTDEFLFDATSEIKKWTSQIAMRLDEQSRRRFFAQIDRLHDTEEWMVGDRPIRLESYKSFIRAYLAGMIGGKPSLALSPDGYAMAIWRAGEDRLTIEFFENDRIRYLVSQTVDNKIERVAAETTISRLTVLLQPFSSERWFRGS